MTYSGFNINSTQGSRDDAAREITPGSRGAQTTQFIAGDVIESRYQVLSVLGQGGFGCVYKVHQILLRKDFALKTLNPVHTSEVTMLRLQKEAQAAGRLEHRNLVRAVDFGMINGCQPFLVMDLVEGPTLAEYLRNIGKLPVSTALEIFIPLAQALAYAHGQGVVHRDLKPSNVILAPGDRSAKFVPKIVDFGIAKTQFSDQSQGLALTGTGDVFGTPMYMSPEQCAGIGVDARSDIYSLGCMLFEALTGAPPFRGRNSLEVMMQHSTAPMPSLREASMGENYPPQLERILASMLAKNPDERYNKSQTLAEDLHWFQQGDFNKISAKAKPKTRATLPQTEQLTVVPEKTMRRQVLTTGLTAVIGIALGIGISALRPGQKTESTKNSATMTMTTAAPATDPEDLGDMSGVMELKLPSGYYSADAANSTEVQLQRGTTFDTNLHSKPDSSSSPDWVFKFPKSRSLGQISWWNSGKLHNVPAFGRQNIPKGSKIIFSALPDACAAPNIWARFTPSELYGVVLAEHCCYIHEDPMSHTIRSIAQQDNLRILTMGEIHITQKAFRSIGDIPHLLWLDLTNVEIFGPRSIKVTATSSSTPHHATGEEIANLKNLQDLHVFRVQKLDNPTPIVAKFAEGSGLRRLCLAHMTLTEDDIKLISKIKGLEILSLRGSDCGGKNPLAQVLKLKRLKGLVVNSSVLAATPGETLNKLHGITVVVDVDQKSLVNPKWNDIWKATINTLPRDCTLIQRDDLASVDNHWFNPLAEDPLQLDI